MVITIYIILGQIFAQELKIGMWLGGFTPSCIFHTRAFMTYLLGGFIYLAKNIIR